MVAKFQILHTKTGRMQRPTKQKLCLKTGKITKLRYTYNVSCPGVEACMHIGLYDVEARPLYDKETVSYKSELHKITINSGAFGLVLNLKFVPFVSDEFQKDGVILLDITKVTPIIKTMVEQEAEVLHF